ncbi:MAG TPA: hypothetical protein VLX12_10415 [Syntrophorhabdales bacterium]|nr:hypothetical protein [Syntrophorhabdales bacterium]
MSKTILVALGVICLAAACALNVASSKLSYGDRLTVAGFPKRVGVATLAGNLAAQAEATDRLSRGLVDLGFQVVARSWAMDKVLRQSAEGISEKIPERIRKRLEEQYGLEGIFVGTLSQDRGNFVDETRLSLRLISVPTGNLVWSTNVVGGGVTGLDGGVNERAVSAVEKALHSLEKDVYPDPKGNPKGKSQASSALQLKGSQSEILH